MTTPSHGDQENDLGQWSRSRSSRAGSYRRTWSTTSRRADRVVRGASCDLLLVSVERGKSFLAHPTINELDALPSRARPEWPLGLELIHLIASSADTNSLLSAGHHRPTRNSAPSLESRPQSLLPRSDRPLHFQPREPVAYEGQIGARELVTSGQRLVAYVGAGIPQHRGQSGRV